MALHVLVLLLLFLLKLTVPAEQEVQAHPQRPHLKGFLQKAREIFSRYNRGVKEYFIKTRD